MTMKKAIAFVVAIVVVLSGICYSGVTEKEVKAADDWQLVWSDEFDGTSLDTNVWTYEIGNGDWGWGNGEVQYYTNRKENVNVSDGQLHIVAKREDYRGSNGRTYKYTSGRLITKHKKYFQYGYMEAKIKVENGNQTGVWPAFWMMGNNIDQVGWPRCGEIDIMEHANSNNYIGGCLHWGVNNTTNHDYYSSGDSGDKYDNYYFSDNVNNGINGWHTYGVLWTEDYLEWYVDGNAYFKQKFTSANAYCVQQAHFFLLNLAIGGPDTPFTGYQTPDPATYKTATMYVDYVRAYQNFGEAETTTKYNGPTITVTEDAVANSTAEWGSFFGGDADWCGSAHGSVTNNGSSADGVTVNVTSTGTDRWGIQTSLNGLSYYPGNTYKYKCTLTSDTDKVVFVKVAGDGSEEISGDYVTLKANVPYNYTKDVYIAEDYEGVLDLYFGLGRCEGDTISETGGYTLKIENVSFTTTAKIPDPNYVPPTTTPGEDITVTDSTTTKKTTTVSKPARAKIKKLKNIKKRKIKVSIKKVKGAKGYQIRWSDSKRFNGYWQKNVTKRTYTIKKLDKNTRYYVKVRAYNLNGKKKVFGKWSKVRKLKVKK